MLHDRPVRTDSIAHCYYDVGAKLAVLLIGAGVEIETPFLSEDEQRELRSAADEARGKNRTH